MASLGPRLAPDHGSYTVVVYAAASLAGAGVLGAAAASRASRPTWARVVGRAALALAVPFAALEVARAAMLHRVLDWYLPQPFEVLVAGRDAVEALVVAALGALAARSPAARPWGAALLLCAVALGARAAISLGSPPGDELALSLRWIEVAAGGAIAMSARRMRSVADSLSAATDTPAEKPSDS